MNWPWNKKTAEEPTPVVKILAHHENRSRYFPADYVMFSVEGSSGKLREVTVQVQGELDRILMLGNVPLAVVDENPCPTCTNLLATGYGYPVNDPAIRAAAERMNLSYQGIDDALERLTPVVGLLSPGTYFLTYGQSYPTDGEGHFFWDIPMEEKSYFASTSFHYIDAYENLVDVNKSAFLYPTQSPNKLDEARVEYYRAQIRAGNPLPPVLTWNLSGSMDAVLDGHHRACACALEGVTVPCLTISKPPYVETYRNGRAEYQSFWPDGTEIPLKQRYSWKRLETLSDVSLLMGESQWKKKHWPQAYEIAAAKYPTWLEICFLNRCPETEPSENGLRKLAAREFEEEEAHYPIAAATLLEYFSRQPGVDAKALGFAFAREENAPVLREAAWRILHGIKHDPEVEAFFVDRLVHLEKGRDAKLWEIADTYWE